MPKNPFHPTLDVGPSLLVGRSDLLEPFAEAIESRSHRGRSRAPGRATLGTGARGSGRRCSRSRSRGGQYRLRLIAAELIEINRRGYVDFALPYLREYLRDEAAAEL